MEGKRGRKGKKVLRKEEKGKRILKDEVERIILIGIRLRLIIEDGIEIEMRILKKWKEESRRIGEEIMLIKGKNGMSDGIERKGGKNERWCKKNIKDN